MPPQSLKLLVVGPKEGGKSTIANFISENSDRLGNQENYRPTIGVRILEVEKNKNNVEIWDVSGDQIYESCWPAIIKDTNGVILVYNPESHLHESEAMLWYEWFVQNAGIDPSQCAVVFEHNSSNSGSSNKKAGAKVKFPPSVRVVSTTFDSPNVFRSEFDRLLGFMQDAVAKQSRNRK